MIGPKPLEALAHRFADEGADVVDPFRWHGDLGHHGDAVPVAGQSLAEDTLRPAVAVAWRDVEEGHAALEGDPDRANGLGVGGRAPDLPDSTAAKADGRHRQPGSAQDPVLHALLPRGFGNVPAVY